MPGFPQHGLYVIIDTTDREQARWQKLAVAVLRGGCDVVQYRNKSANRELMRKEAAILKTMCGEYNVPCIVNDCPTLAAQVKADGVHSGKEDVTLNQARKLLGDDSIIGLSCYNRPELALAGTGADYVAFGSIHRSLTKPEATPCGYDVLRQAARLATVPVVAIGGISISNAVATLCAGADVLAVLGDLERADNPELRTAEYKTILTEHHHE